METVGFKHFSHQDLLDPGLSADLKRSVVLFDELRVPQELYVKTRDYLDQGRQLLTPELNAAFDRNVEQIEMLRANGILSSYSVMDLAAKASKPVGDGPEHARTMAIAMQFINSAPTKSEEGAAFLDSRLLWGDLVSRLAALIHRRDAESDALPLLHRMPAKTPELDTEQTQVALVVLNRFPVVAPAVSWERVIEFSRDVNTRRLVNRLRVWMDGVTDLPPRELARKMDAMLDDYEQYMKVHAISHDIGTLRGVITLSAELVTNVAKLQWGKVVDSVYDVIIEHTELLKAELNAPGRQLALLSQAKAQLAQ